MIISIVGVIFVLGCGALAGGAPPNNSTGEPVAGAQPTAPSLPESTPTIFPIFTPQPALPERRRLTLEFPPQIRAGDSDVVRLTLEVDDLGNVTPTAQIGGHVITGKVIEIPNLYESHHVIAETRFDIAGLEVRPAELSSEPLAQGTSATFYWSIRPQEAGVYRGTLWLYLRFVDKQSGEETRKTLSAQIIEIEAVNLLGLSGNFARTTGVIGSVVGTVIGFPFFEDLIKFVFKRRSRRNT
ncbi:MAG TPA: hypothetical protein VK249_30595 [Anaerolineales bacterium]|nr:hypothetical protein [Anaerolineales bacterium]